MRNDRLRRALWAAASLLLVACGGSDWPQRLQSSLPGAWKEGQVNIRFSWEGGRPTFARNVFLFGRLESRTDPRVPGTQEGAAGPVPYPSNDSLSFEDVPNDKQLVVIVEFREDDAPLSQLLYYGLSEPFELHPSRSGGTNTVDVLVPIVPRPRLEGVQFVDAQGQPITAPVNTAGAALQLQTDRGACVQFSATTEFTQAPADCTALPGTPQPANMMRTVTVPDVALPDCTSPCQASLFVRVLDQNHVPGPLGVATIQRDTTPPTGHASPSLPRYGLGSTIEYTLVTSEPLQGGTAPVPVVERGAASLLGFFGPGVAVSPTTFRYEHVVVAAESGNYRVSFSLVDAAGNASTSVITGEPFEVVAVGPVIETFTALNSTAGLDERVSAVAGFNTLNIHAVVAVDPAVAAPDATVRVGNCGAVTAARAPMAVGNGRYDYAWNYTVCTSDPDGYLSVILDVIDAAQNRASTGTSVLVDQIGPGLLSPASLVRADGNQRAMVPPSTVFLNRTPFQGGITPSVRAAFWSSERLRVAPVIRVGNATATLVMGGAGEAFHVAEFVDAQNLPDGDVTVTATLEDRVGNTGNVMLGTITVDNTPPAVDAAGMIHVRRPWGTTASPAAGYELRATAALEPFVSLDVYLPGTAGNAVGALLGTADTGMDGTVPNGAVTLLDQDAPVVLVQTRDRAGNRSAPTPVNRGQWVATLREGAGLAPNPHRAVVSRWLSQGAPQPAALSSPANATQLAALSTADGTAVTLDALPQDAWIGITRAPVGITPAFAYVHDETRNRGVLTGGTLRTMDTWEWDPVQGWSHPDLAHQPEPVGNFSLAFHPPSGKTVLVGGSAPNDGTTPCPSGANSPRGACLVDHHWAFDGTDWAALDGGVQPPGRESAALAYDPAHNNLLLFGGLHPEGDDGGHMLADTWTFDGVTWTNRNIPAFDAPEGRTQAGAAFHPQRNAVAVYGGSALLSGANCPAGTTGNAGTGCSFDDTWEWDGTAWNYGGQQANGPGPRAQHGMATLGTGVLLAGGSRPKTSACTADEDDTLQRCTRHDTWQRGADGGWLPVTASGSTADSTAVLASDTPRAQVFSYTPGKLQVHTANGWTPVWSLPTNLVPEVSPIPPGAVAGPRAMAEFPPTRSVYLYGGNSGLPTDPLWRWDGARWTQQQGVAGGDGEPAGRVYHSMTWVADHGRLYLFGGRNNTNAASCPSGGCQDLWAFDGTTWDALPNGTTRLEHAAAPAWINGAMVLLVHGGRTSSAGAYVNTQAAFDGNTWTVPPGVTPPARGFSAMAYEPTRRTTVLFGGLSATGTNVTNDLWVLQNGTWSTPAQGATRPGPRAGHALAYSAELDGVVLYGGFDASCISALTRCAFLADAWLWKNNAWTQLLTAQGDLVNGQPRDGNRDSQPRGLGNPSLAVDPARGGLLLRGDGVNTWNFQPQQDDRRAGVVVALDLAGLDGAQPTVVVANTVAGGTTGARAQFFHTPTASWSGAVVNTAAANAPAALPPLRVDTSAVDLVDASGRLWLRVDSVGGGDASSTAVDAVEVTVDYAR